MKKILSILTILIIIVNNIFLFKLYANENQSNNNDWTYEMASHLARKALFWVDWNKVKELHQAWSAENAVNILFPSIYWPNRTDFENRLDSIISWDNFNTNNWDHMKSFYLVKKWEDPYQAKAKLFTVFEDIFSSFVSSWNDITYIDIENNHNLLYNLTLSNYKEMVKRNLYNNWQAWDYAVWKFLDLFNQRNPNSPNQNYARELLQLILMLENIPTESADEWAKRNYTEEDVTSLAKILVWFESDENTHLVTYNNNINTNTKIVFLDWDLKSWDTFNFYNSETWEIDVQLLKNPRNWNNWLPDNIIDYIFSKREYEISMFLADRLYRFYVAQNPTKNELNSISEVIINNNFNFYNTVKWLLASDMMYSEKSMWDLIYKNPLELSIWTANIFWLDLRNVRIWSLINLWRNPYFPPTIFGRDWFDNNHAFFTAYTQTQWVNESSYFVNSLNLDTFISDNIYITPYSWNDEQLQDILYSNKSELLNVKTWSWQWISWVMNLNNFNIKNSDNINIEILNWFVNFEDFSIETSEWHKIEIEEWRIDYKNSNLVINKWRIDILWTKQNISWVINIDWFYILQKEFNKENLISYLETKIFLDRKLPKEIKDKLIEFLSFDMNWNPVNFDLSNNNYKNFYVKSVIQFMISQPEYILQSWYKEENISENNEKKGFIDNDSKLIIIKAGWWLDSLHAIIPKEEYETYLEYRWDWALIGDEIISLNNEYYLNSKLAPFKNLFDSWNLKIINRVWTPAHSRAHDWASQKITSVNNVLNVQDDWIIWHFIKDEPFEKTIVMGSYRPLIFRWWNYLNIWSNAYFRITDSTNNNFRNYKRDFLVDLLENRNYPWNSESVFKNSVTINNVALNSVNNWWRAWAWFNMIDNFTFLEAIFDTDVSNIARMWADWWYDTHWNQKNTLDNNLERVAERTFNYFERVKDKQDITILFFSEFWRTNRINASNWTDHGQWGTMFLLSNNENILKNLDKPIYWNNSFAKSKNNWLWVWIDYRTVYTSVLDLLYSKDISDKLWAKYELEKYIDETWPKPELLRSEYEHINNSRTRVRLKFDINDENFFPDQASYVKIEYWKEKDNMMRESDWRISREMTVSEDYIDIFLNNIESKTNYFYKITLFDNQYNETILEWSFVSPEIKNNSDILSTETDTRLIKYRSTVVNNEFDLTSISWSWLLLWDLVNSSEINWENNIKLLTNSWTFVEKLNSKNWEKIWNWGFILPKFINKDLFLSEESKINSTNLNRLNIENIVKVWADTLWVGMDLNKEVQIKVPLTNSSKNYTVITSQDWINWAELNNQIQKNWNELNFKTNHFSYFAIVEIDSSWNLIINVPVVVEEEKDNSENPIFEETSKSFSSWWWWARLVRDFCPFWDYSPSYYDNTCWIDPDEKIATMWVMQSESYRLENALEEVREKEEDKAKIFDQTFLNNDNINDKTNVLILIREKISTYNIWEYKINFIQWSNINNQIKALAEYIINQNFEKEYTKKLIDNINELAIYIWIYKLDIDKETKDIVLKKLNEIIKHVSINFRDAKRNKNISKKPKINNNINNTTQEKEKVTVQKEQETINKKVESRVEEKTNNNILNNELVYKVNIANIHLKWDPYWKTNVWILQQWDIVEQITQLHEKWFFKIKVIKSNNVKEWTEGYIFLKYLTK